MKTTTTTKYGVSRWGGCCAIHGAFEGFHCPVCYGCVAIADYDALAARVQELETANAIAVPALLRIRSQTTPGRAASIARDAIRALTCVCGETSSRNCPVHQATEER